MGIKEMNLGEGKNLKNKKRSKQEESNEKRISFN